MSEEYYSSGEDENETFDQSEEFHIDFEEAEFVPGHELFYDNSFYPSIKEFIGSPSCIQYSFEWS